MTKTKNAVVVRMDFVIPNGLCITNAGGNKTKESGKATLEIFPKLNDLLTDDYETAFAKNAKLGATTNYAAEISSSGGHHFFCRRKQPNVPKTKLVLEGVSRVPVCYYYIKKKFSVEDGVTYCKQIFGGNLLRYYSRQNLLSLYNNHIIDNDDYALHPVSLDVAKEIREAAGVKENPETEKPSKGKSQCYAFKQGVVRQVNCASERLNIICVTKESSWLAYKKGEYQVVSECPQVKADPGVVRSTLVHHLVDDSWFCIIFYEHQASSGSLERIADFCETNFAGVPFYVGSSSEDELLRSLMPWQYYTILMSTQLKPAQIAFPDGTNAFYVRWRVFKDDDSKADGECIYIRADPVRDAFIAADCPVSPKQRKALICRTKITAETIDKYSSVPEMPLSNNTYELVDGICNGHQEASMRFKPVMISVNGGQKYYCLYDFSFFSSGGLTIKDGEEFCVTFAHGHLLSIADNNELKFINDLLYPKRFLYNKFLMETRLLGIEFNTDPDKFFDGTDSSFVTFMANYSKFYHYPNGQCALSARTENGDFIWPTDCREKHFYHTCKVYVDNPRFRVANPLDARSISKERWPLIIAGLTLFGLINLCICVMFMEGKIKLTGLAKEEPVAAITPHSEVTLKPTELKAPGKPNMPFSYLAGVKSAMDLKRRNMPEEVVVESTESSKESESHGMLKTPMPSRGIRGQRAPKTRMSGPKEDEMMGSGGVVSEGVVEEAKDKADAAETVIDTNQAGAAETMTDQTDVAEPVKDKSQADTAEPVTDESQTDVAEPVTDKSQADTAEPVTDKSQADTAEPVTDKSQADTADPVTDKSQADTADPVTDKSQTDEAEPVADKSQTGANETTTNENSEAELVSVKGGSETSSLASA